MPLRLQVYVASDWWLLQANGSARVRLGATEIIASVKVRRDRPRSHFFLLQIGQGEYFCMSISILCTPSSILDLASKFLPNILGQKKKSTKQL
jgi:hypothetical protein